MTDDLLIFKRIAIGEIVTEADFAKCNGTAELARRFYAAKHEGLPDHKLGEILIEAKLSQDDITSIFYSPDNADEESLFHNKYIKPLFSVSDALKPQPPIDWAIDKLVEFGGVMGIFGKPGSKKTYAMMSLAMCLATGKKWLDFEVKQCPVLWIDEDSGERRIKRRLGDVARGYDAGENTPFQVLSLAGIDVLDNQSAANFERLIRNQGAKLVVVDTLADIIGGAKVISPDEMQPVLQCLRRIAERTGALIIFIHHTNKAGDFLGAINIAGKADLLLQVDSATDSPIIKFESTKARDTGAANFAAKACFYPDSARFWLEPVDIDGLNQAKRISTMSGANKYVYEFIQQNGVSEIEDMIDEELHKRATIEKAVSRLCDDKMIRRVNEGGRGVKGQYAIL